MMILEVGNARLDYSHKNGGYIIAEYTGDKLCKAGIQCGMHNQNFVIQPGKPRQIPLCFGDGEYNITIYEQIRDHMYRKLMGLSDESVYMQNALNPFLGSTVYADYNKESLCVLKANEICKGMKNDIELLSKIYTFVIDNIKYDYALAKELSNKSGWWVPDPDEVLNAKKSICFGFSSLFASMCRSRGIATKVVIGNAPIKRHAWNEVFVRNDGKIGGIKVRKNTWTRLDLSYAACGVSLAFMSDNGSYIPEYYG